VYTAHKSYVCTIVCLAAALCAAACGLLTFEELTGGGAEETGPPPDVELAGQAEVVRIAVPAQTLEGPAAQGGAGDFLLQSSLAQFVIAAPQAAWRDETVAGGVIDAAIHGGQDYLHAFLPHVGDESAPPLVCDSAEARPPSAAGEPAEVSVVAHRMDAPGLIARTAYRLGPDSRSLEVITTVENKTQKTMHELALGDIIFHGRTERFAEGAGLNPVGKGQTTMLSFFGGEFTWTVHAEGGMPFWAAHDTARSRVVYCEITIPPGESRTYKRRLTASYGWPANIAQTLSAVPAGRFGTLEVTIVDEATGNAVEGAYVQFDSERTGPFSLARTNKQGRAIASLPQDSYNVRCLAQGRRAVTCRVSVAAGTRGKLKVSMSTPAMLRLRVKDQKPDEAARVVVRRANMTTPELLAGPQFSALGPGTMVLVRGDEAVDVALPVAPQGYETAYFVLASRGPLFEMSARRVVLEPGRTTDMELALTRAVDPEAYVALDARQPAQGDLERLLTPAERATLNMAEGLHAAIERHTGRRLIGVGPEWTPRSPLLPAVGWWTLQTGALSVIASRVDVQSRRFTLPPYSEWGKDAEDTLAMLRRYFPRSIIQIEAPLDSHTGYFALTGFSGTAPAHKGFSPHFDSICILTGNDTLAALETLPRWFALLNEGRRVVATAGSNSACMADARRMGARTFIRCRHRGPEPTVAEIWESVEALVRQPDAFVTNGPFLKVSANGAPTGSTLKAQDGTVRVRVRVEAPQWISISRVKIFQDGRLAKSLPAGERKESLLFDDEIALSFARDGWIVVLAEGDKNMSPVYCEDDGGGATPLAISNPFFVDADGDGVWRPAP
jgi:hypothetical protein